MKGFYNRLISLLKVSYLSARAPRSLQAKWGWSAFIPRSSAIRRVYLDHAGATEIGVLAKRALLETIELYGNASAIYHEGVLAKNALKDARAWVHHNADND